MSKRIKKGIIASPGIRMGKAIVFRGDEIKIPKYHINEANLEKEIERFNDALNKTKQEIIEIQNKIAEEKFNDLADIFSTHIMALEDPHFVERARRKIRQEQRNAEWVINDISIELINSLSQIDDEYLRERIVDVSDINKRLISNLQQKNKVNLSDINEYSILFASDLTPSETALLNRQYILAFVTDHGGKTSHTAIMARSMDIPAIVGMDDITSYVKNDDYVIVDAIHGEIIINPSQEEIGEYKKYQLELEKIEEELSKLTTLPSVTTDSIEVFLYGNLEIPDEMENIKNHGAHGVGLFRTEFLFLGKNLPDEESQFQEYKKVVEFFNPYPVTIRTLDFGGDKIPGSMKFQREMNPFLGCRSIRFSLRNIEIFKTQLRAILRASAFGKIKIMFPMISNLSELIEAKKITHDVMDELRISGIPFDPDVKLGIMIEVPSAVIAADILAEEADFFSVGTNDLVQYILAVDRSNEKIADIYNPLDISVLRFLKMMADTSHKYSIPISICGEMAGEAKYTMLLLGLGFLELSMSSKNLYLVKNVIRSVSMEECQNFSHHVLSLKKQEEIEQIFNDVVFKKFPDLILK